MGRIRDEVDTRIREERFERLRRLGRFVRGEREREPAPLKGHRNEA